MQISILVESKMLPIPDGVKVLQDYGIESVTLECGHVMATGNCMVLSSELEIFKDWLFSADCVWVGNGQSRFKAMHIK